MRNQLGKRRYQLRSIIIGSLFVLLVGHQFIRVTAGPAQQDTNCPITLSDDDCEILLAAQTALGAARSVHIDAYELTATIDLDSDSIALSSSGSGDVLLGNGRISSADFHFDNTTFTSAETQFEGEGIVRFVNGVVYVGIEGDDDVTEWVGVESDGFVPQLAFMDGFVELFNELNDVPTVVTWGRDEDFVADETLVAVLYMDFSARGLLQSSVFVEWLAEGLTEILADSFEGELVSPTLATAIVSELANQFSADIEDEYIFRITQQISLEDFHIQRMTVELSFSVGLGILGGFAASVDGESPESLSIAVDFDVTFGEYAGDVSIEAPETYEDISSEIAGLFDALLTDIIAGMGVGEDNNTSTHADDSIDLAANEPITGMLEADSGSISYRFEANAGDIIQIAVRADEGSNLDTYLQLFGADGERLADNDDALSPPSEFNLGTFDSYIEYEMVEDGVYFVEVSSVFTGDSGSYMVTLRIE